MNDDRVLSRFINFPLHSTKDQNITPYAKTIHILMGELQKKKSKKLRNYRSAFINLSLQNIIIA